MNDLRKEELLKLARLSSLEIDDSEAELFTKQLQTLLSYTSELESVELGFTAHPHGNINVFRDDKLRASTSEDVLAQAPKSHDSYFVVPKILKN